MTQEKQCQFQGERVGLAGLTGKIAINSTWLETEVRHEISNLFASSFGLSDGEILPFVYLRYLNYSELDVLPIYFI